MKFFKTIIVFLFIINISYASDNVNFDEFFLKLDEKGIKIGKDISSDDLYKLLNNKNIKQSDINNIVNKISQLLNSNLNQKQKIIENLKKNSNSAMNKELLNYLQSDTQYFETIKNSILKEDNNLSKSKLFDYIKSIMN